MKSEMKCAGEEVLVPTVDAGGLDEIRITQLGAMVYVLSVKVQTKPGHIYLATRRKPMEPRYFKGIEAAVAVGRRLFKVKKFVLIFRAAR